MMKKILCLTAVLMIAAVIPAAAETVQPVTAEALVALLESVRTEVAASEPLNNPTDAEAQSEDGTLFLYETARIYAAGTALTAETPVNALVFGDSEGPVIRGIGIDSLQEELLAAFPTENTELAGTREEAVLYLKETEQDGFFYGRILRDGQRVAAVEYGELMPDGDGFRRVAVTFSLEEARVTAVRVDGLNPEEARMDANFASEFLAEMEKVLDRDEYRAVKTSRINGMELAPFDESDLVFSGISYTALTPEKLPGDPEREIIDNEDGSWLLRCEGDGYEAVFRCDENGRNAQILSFSIRDDGIEGPRCVRLGDKFYEDYSRFRNGENETSEELTELLYGTEGTAPWGFASYDPSAGETSLKYVTVTQDGMQVELLLRYTEEYLTEIMLQTV